MTAQERWKELWRAEQEEKRQGHDDTYAECLESLLDVRREAALERKLEAAQRKIDEQARQLWELQQGITWPELL